MAVEEQVLYVSSLKLRSGGATRVGQKLTIPNRVVSKLGFWLSKVGSPTGDVIFEIRKVSDDSLICSKLWGDAADLALSATYYEVTLVTAELINEEVRILAEAEGANADNCPQIHFQNTDVKANEYVTYYISPTYTDNETWDMAYRYTYSEPPPPAGGGGPAVLVAAGVI